MYIIVLLIVLLISQTLVKLLLQISVCFEIILLYKIFFNNIRLKIYLFLYVSKVLYLSLRSKRKVVKARDS